MKRLCIEKRNRTWCTAIVTLGVCGLLLSCAEVLNYNTVYADPAMWYDNGRDTDTSRADVFYVLPSCNYDWTDSLGEVHHHTCLTDSVQRVRMERSFPVADAIFGDSANFFSPYYRQISLNAWAMDPEVRDELLQVTLADVRSAFSYYLEHWNGGRPFVLAGFSQGAFCALDLLQNMSPEVADRMVAAYIIGYPVTQELMDRCERIRPAQGPDDTGVCIAFSTVSDRDAVTPLINGGNAMIVNPASWTTDILWHQLNDTVNVRIDRDRNVLIADGVDASRYVKPRLKDMIPEGNLHLAELELYSALLKDNVKLRIRTYGAGF
ncbi:MAG: DUF3089 domain-containing protein [Bacteroidaceae bacterium]|nr:DUF3089 domain-containing protein [Bacteroidaceae bacterium]